MSALPAFIRLVRVIPWQVVERAPAVPATGDDLVPRIKELDIQLDALRRLDEPPANPEPPPKKKPTPSQPVGDTAPAPQPQPQPQGDRFRLDPKTCTITRPPGKNQEELKTMACIAWNVSQVMVEAYNRGYATGRAVSKKPKARCVRARDDAAWLSKRLERIILSQDNPQTHRRVVNSRKA